MDIGPGRDLRSPLVQTSWLANKENEAEEREENVLKLTQFILGFTNELASVSLENNGKLVLLLLPKTITPELCLITSHLGSS